MVLAPAIRLVGLTTYTLTVDRTTIGRAVAAMIRTDDKKASRVHAEIILADGEIAIEDKGSVNGTRVNGKEIRERRTLAHGDRIKIGETEWTVETS
jgi:pSer/pThr/pTyr-binding forkhead associated (FHA) protein